MNFKVSLLVASLLFTACKKDDYKLKSNFLANKELITNKSKFYSYFMTKEKDLSRLVVTPKRDENNTIFISAPIKNFIHAHSINTVKYVLCKQYQGIY